MSSEDVGAIHGETVPLRRHESPLLKEQELAVRLLGSHFKTGRLSHAYLFTGVGTPYELPRQLAMLFACALNCEKNVGAYCPPEDGFVQRCVANNTPLHLACDCNACRKIKNRLHPDVHWIGEDLKTKSIKIEETRNIIQGAGLKPFEGKKKIFILLGPERLTLEAANAFLKILEEPPKNTHFILVVENKFCLLDTIQSRCFEIRLKPEGRGVLFATQRWTNPSSGGQYAPTGEMMWPEGLAGKSWSDWLDGYQNAERPKVKENLALLVEYVMHHIRVGAGSPRPQTQGEETSPLQQGHIPQWIEAMDKILETQEALEANANQKLALTRLAMHLEKCIPSSS